MKIKDFARMNVNRANKQVSFNIQSKKLKKLGITPEEVLNFKIVKGGVKWKKKP
jgi:hypothetical protein